MKNDRPKLVLSRPENTKGTTNNQTKLLHLHSAANIHPEQTSSQGQVEHQIGPFLS